MYWHRHVFHTACNHDVCIASQNHLCCHIDTVQTRTAYDIHCDCRCLDRVAGACRTAIGTMGGSLSTTPAQELGAIVIKEASTFCDLCTFAQCFIFWCETSYFSHYFPQLALPGLSYLTTMHICARTDLTPKDSRRGTTSQREM